MPTYRTAATLVTCSTALIKEDAPALNFAADDAAARMSELLAPVFSGEVKDPTNPSNEPREDLGLNVYFEPKAERSTYDGGFNDLEEVEGSIVVRTEVAVDIDRLPGDEAYRDSLIEGARSATKAFLAAEHERLKAEDS